MTMPASDLKDDDDGMCDSTVLFPREFFTKEKMETLCGSLAEFHFPRVWYLQKSNYLVLPFCVPHPSGSSLQKCWVNSKVRLGHDSFGSRSLNKVERIKRGAHKAPL